MSSTVLSVAKLDFTNLRTFYIKVDMEYDNRKNAAFAILTKLSRDLLKVCEEFGGCLAHPERDLCTLIVVASPAVMDKERIIDFLKEQHLILKMDCDCDSFAIEKCLSFAIFYFMEKVNWFRIGDCFVQDGFLWWKQTNVARIQILTHCSAEGNIYIKFTAEMVRIHPFEHWILDSDERFADLNSGPISRDIRPRWVSCLPKLGRGQIVKIHRRIPESAPFETYTQMKSYWKKTYGYDLPPTEPEVYYDVLFHNEQSMLYPFYCVLTGPPEVLQVRSNCVLTRGALALFLKAFNEASIVICGTNLVRDKHDCQSAQFQLDVLSITAGNPSKLEKTEKDSKSIGKKEEKKVHEVRKIYPKIPAGVKRAISSSEGQIIAKKSRPSFSVSVD